MKNNIQYSFHLFFILININLICMCAELKIIDESEERTQKRQLAEKLKIFIGQNNLTAAQKLLYKHPEIVNIETSGATPLILAAEKERADFLHLLLNSKANPNTPTKISRRTPFMHATLFGTVPGMRLLLQHNANPYARNKGGKTAQDLNQEYIDALAHEMSQPSPLADHFFNARFKELEEANDKDEFFKILRASKDQH